MTTSTRGPSELLRAAYDEICRLRLELDQRQRREHEPIAVIGIGCRLARGISGPDGLWRALCQGIDAVGEVPRARWDVEPHFSAEPGAPGKTYSRWGAFIDDVDRFEPEFFGISPREAAELDPQQRLLLEVAWEALENAALPPSRYRGSQTGLFVGITMDDYSQWSINSGDLARIDPYSSLGNTRSIAVGRVAYTLDLHGPALQLDTTCSSSLLATHLACQSLRLGESDLALAGGVNLILSPSAMVGFSSLRALSPTGRCRTFDASADGYVRGEGAALVVLKRLSDAVADRDHIWAVIRASAANHDGRSNGLTAPNGSAQEAVIRRAMQSAALEPHDVCYVEAHGTGTPLGDPIEIMALSRALCEGRKARGPLYVGSLKSNFGHMEAAAGVMGLVKAALALKHRSIPPNLHFETPNPRIPWRDLPLCVPTANTPWPAEPGRGTAGVNSYGMSGTNVHAVLAEAPLRDEPVRAAERPGVVLSISARKPESLTALAAQHAQALERLRAPELADYCYSVNVGRARFDYRAAFSAADGEELARRLASFAEVPPEPAKAARADKLRYGFLFTGQGAQWSGMGRTLFETSPTFRATLEHVAALFDRESERPLLELMFDDRYAAELGDTRYAQCALFAYDFALAGLLRAWGIEPALLVGHSLGEYVAAVVGGVLELEDAVKLVRTRARLMSEAPGDGAMLAVFAAFERVRRELDGSGLELAATNAPEQCVLSGPRDRIQAFARELAARGVRSEQLKVSKAFHSAQMDPVVAELAECASRFVFRRPKVPIVLNATGAAAPPELDWPAYLARQLRSPVLFEQSLGFAVETGCRGLIEVGPAPVLTAFARAALPELGSHCFASVSSKQDEWKGLLALVARLAATGSNIDFEGFDRDYSRAKCSTATYAFARERYWLAHEPPWANPSPAPTRGDWQCVHEAPLSLAAAPFLGDHCIFGEVVVPAAHWLSFVAARATRATRDGAASVCELTEVTFPKALILGENGLPRVGLYLAPSEGGEPREFEIRSDGSTIHARGKVRTLAHDPAAPAAPALSLAESAESAESLYASQWRRGVELGESFRWLTEVHALGNEARGRLDPPEAAKWGEYSGLHPGALDSAFQLLARTVELAEDECVIPAQVGRVTIRAVGRHGTLECRAWSRLSGDGANGARGELVLGNADNVTAVVEGLEVRRVTRALLGAGAPSRFRCVWRERPAPPAASSTAAGTWLFLEDAHPLAGALRIAIEARGGRVLRIERGETWGRRGADHLVIGRADPEELGRAFRELTTGLELTGIAYLWSLHGGARPDELELLNGEGWQGLLGLAQALVNDGTRGLRVCALTTGRLNVRGDEPLESAEGGLLQGLLAGLNAECDELRFVHVDLDPAREEHALASALESLTASDAEPVHAWRAGRRWVRRLVRDVEPRFRTARLRADRTYLVTGGTGALGLELASWLVENGARSLALVGRRPPSTAALETITRLRACGAVVEVFGCDVAQRAEVSALFRTLGERRMSELAGVFHAAAVTDDAALERLTWAGVRRVLEPKADAAYHLYQATRELKLDHFVLFSSLAGTLGSAGQIHYAAANGYLDALAELCRANGQPALSIAWGPWDGAGIAGRLDANQRRRLTAAGIGFLRPQKALATLGAFLGAAANPVVAELDFARLGATAPQNRALLEEASAEEANTDPDVAVRTTPSWASELRRIDPDERARYLTLELRALVGAALGLDGHPLDADQPLRDLGMDSLMMAELSTRVRRELGVRVTALGPETTLADLVSSLLVELPGADVAASGRSLVELTRSGSGLPFFCVHAIGGDVACYEPLARELGRPFCAFQAPGYDGESPPLASVNAMAAAYLRELRRRQPSGPYLLGGWSFGGVVAFEMAAELRAAGETVSRLVLIDSYAPLAAERSLLGRIDVLRAVAHDLGQIMQVDFPFPEQALEQLPADARLEFLLERAGALELAAGSSGAAVFRSNLRALYLYAPRPYAGDVQVFCAARPARVLTKNASSSWRELVTGGFRLEIVPGDHYELVREPRALAERLRLVLDAVSSDVA